MKTRIITISSTLALFLAAGISGKAQGTFQNLNFEAANIPAGTQPNNDTPIAIGLPGWSAYFTSTFGESNGVTQIWYDGISLGGSAISISDNNAGLGFVPLQGRYSAMLFGGGSTPQYAPTISQTGRVPAGRQSLQMEVYSSGTPFIVTLGGQVINMVPLSTVQLPGFPTHYTIYGGDISAFAGQVAQLSITQPPSPDNPPSELFLDNLVFSPDSVPEPGVLGLSALGALLVGWRILRRRR